MNDAEPTLDNLAGLSESARERIRDSRLEAWYQTDQGQNARTLHPLNFRSGPKWEVWQDEKHLGEGMNGSLVVLQRKIDPPPPHGNRGAPELRAVKIIPVSEARSKYYFRELESMIKFSHQGYSNLFVRFLGWYKLDHRLHIISEYCELGDLTNYLKERNGRLPEDQVSPACLAPVSIVKDISWQVLQGVRLMHKESCVHGDIKPSNVLIIKNPPDYWWVKVCDLGLSKRVEQSRGTTSTHYSRGFCPPEKMRLFDDDVVVDGYKADMWCFGEFVFQALTGKATFKSTTDMDKWCRSGTGFPDQRLRDTRASDDVVDFLHSVMVSDPARRLTASEACEHRWMRKEPNISAQHLPPAHRAPFPTTSPGWMPGAWKPSPETPAATIFDPPPSYGQYGINTYGANSTPITAQYPDQMTQTSTPGARSMGSPGVQEIGSESRTESKNTSSKTDQELGMTIEQKVLSSFKKFAVKQREQEEKAKLEKQNKANDEFKLSELKKFANTFKLGTPLPADLDGIVRKDPEKQNTVLSTLQQGQDLVEQRLSADNGTPERVKDGPVTPLANSSVSQVENSAGKQPLRITTSKPMTWAERVAQPVPRPARTDLSGVPAMAPVKGVEPKAGATGHVDGNSDEQDHDFHWKNSTGTTSRPNAHDTPSSAVTTPVQASRSQRKRPKRKGSQYPL